MVKAKELRIGNYIRMGGNTIDTYQSYKPVRVDANLIKAIAEENEERGNDYVLSVYQPIEINKEILLKMGAENFQYSDLILKNCHISFAKCRNAFIHAATSVELKTVHQVQNLFYELLNVEFEIEW